MTTDINPRAADFQDYRRAVRELCATFGSEYWRAIEERSEYPDAFVKALSDAGWLAALIPAEYGGGGLSVTAVGAHEHGAASVSPPPVARAGIGG